MSRALRIFLVLLVWVASVYFFGFRPGLSPREEQEQERKVQIAEIRKELVNERNTMLNLAKSGECQKDSDCRMELVGDSLCEEEVRYVAYSIKADHSEFMQAVDAYDRSIRKLIVLRDENLKKCRDSQVQVKCRRFMASGALGPQEKTMCAPVLVTQE